MPCPLSTPSLLYQGGAVAVFCHMAPLVGASSRVSASAHAGSGVLKTSHCLSLGVSPPPCWLPHTSGSSPFINLSPIKPFMCAICFLTALRRKRELYFNDTICKYIEGSVEITVCVPVKNLTGILGNLVE